MGLDWKARGVLDDFRQCQRTSQDTDLVFHCTNGNVSAHQMIFAGISRLFTNLMQRYLIGQELIPLDLNISVPDIRLEHMEMVVELVYTGQVRITKRDYPCVQEICQLLDLCVPIADNDDLNRNQCNDDANVDRSNEDILHFVPPIPEVSIPLKPCPDARAFVCDQCYAIFPMKIALKRHRQIRHGETESCALKNTDLTGSPEVSNTATIQRISKRQRSSNIDHDDDRSNDDVQNSEALMPVVSIPLKSWPSGRIFVCDQCYETFPLKMALKRHKESRHGEPKSHALNIRDSVESPEVSKLSSVKQVSKRQRPSTVDRSLFYSPNEEPMFECPDCLKRLPSTRIQSHVIIHLEKELNEFITDSPSAPGLEKCKLCLHEASSHINMRIHVGVTHKILLELANEAQIKFLQNAGGMFARRQASSPEPHKLLPIKTVRARSQILPNEDLPAVWDFEENDSIKNTNESQSHVVENANECESLPAEDANECELNGVYECESPALNATEVAGLPEMSCPSTMKRVSKRQRSSTIDKSLYYSLNDEPTFECPDCLKRLPSNRIFNHVFIHLEKKLNEFIADNQSVPGQCKLCSYKAPSRSYMRRHLAVTHKMLLEIANKAQMKFLRVAVDMFDGQFRSSSKPNKLLPNETMKTLTQILQNEDVSEMSDIENSNALEETNENDSQRHEVSIKSGINSNPRQSEEETEFPPPKPPKEAKGSVKRPSESHELLTEKKFKTLKTRNRILPIEHLPETSEIEKNNALEHATETRSLRPKVLAKSRDNPNPRQSDVETKLLSKKPFLEGSLRGRRIYKKPFYARNGEESFKCPDCHKRVIHYRGREHVASHLWKYLKKFVNNSYSIVGRYKCKLCGKAFGCRSNVIRHVGSSHNLTMKFANEAQKQFIMESGTKKGKLNGLESPGRPSLSRKKKNQCKGQGSLNFLETEDTSHRENNETNTDVEDEDSSQRTNNETDVAVEDEDLSKIQDNDGEVEIDNALEDEDLAKLQNHDGEIEMDDALEDEDLSKLQNHDGEVEMDNALEDEDLSKIQGNDGEIEIGNALEDEDLSKLQDNDSAIKTAIVVEDEGPMKMEGNDDDNGTDNNVVDEAADILDFFLISPRIAL